MKTIFIDITGVLRDTNAKIASEYRKYYIESELEDGEDENFEYDMVLPVTTNVLMDHFKFQSEDEMKYFLFVEFAMEIFGHSAPVYSGVFNDLAELMRDGDYKFTIVSDEKGKGKPASLFFLSKNSCYVDNYRFYKEGEIEEMWDNCDVWITSNPTIMESKPENKKVVKVITEYNKEVTSDFEVEKLIELKDLEI